MALIIEPSYNFRYSLVLQKKYKSWLTIENAYTTNTWPFSPQQHLQRDRVNGGTEGKVHSDSYSWYISSVNKQMHFMHDYVGDTLTRKFAKFINRRLKEIGKKYDFSNTYIIITRYKMPVETCIHCYFDRSSKENTLLKLRVSSKFWLCETVFKCS